MQILIIIISIKVLAIYLPLVLAAQHLMGIECFFNKQFHFLIQVKAKALVSAEMKSIYHKRIEEDERLKFEVEEVFKEIQKYLHS